VVGGDVDILHQFRTQVALMQHAAIDWLHSVVPKLIVVKPSDFMHWYALNPPLSFAVTFFLWVATFWGESSENLDKSGIRRCSAR